MSNDQVDFVSANIASPDQIGDFLAPSRSPVTGDCSSVVSSKHSFGSSRQMSRSLVNTKFDCSRFIASSNLRHHRLSHRQCRRPQCHQCRQSSSIWLRLLPRTAHLQGHQQQLRSVRSFGFSSSVAGLSCQILALVLLWSFCPEIFRTGIGAYNWMAGSVREISDEIS